MPVIDFQLTKERLYKRAFAVISPGEHLKRATVAGDLRKCLGPWELTFLGTGSIIGAGVFVLSGVAANESAGPAVIVSYMIAALAALLSAFAYAEFSCEIPVAGGAYTYISSTFGELAAWTVAWNMILETTLSAAAVARGFASYLATLVGLDPSQLRIPLGPFQLDFTAALLICLLSALVAAGTRESAVFNMSVSMTNITVIIFVLCAGFPQASSANLAPFMPYGVRGVFSAASMVFFSYIGFDYLANASEEARNPTRDLPIAIGTSLGIATTLYVLMSTAIVMMVPYSEINVHAPFSSAFLQHGMVWATKLVSVGALLGIVTSTMTGLLSQARLYVVLGRQHLLPGWLAAVHKTRGTPVAATALTAAFAGLLALLLNIDVLAELVSIGTLYVFMMTCCGVLYRRYHQPGSPYAANILARIAAIAASSAAFSVSFTFEAPWPAVAVFLLLWLAATLSCYMLPIAYQPTGFRMPFFPITPSLGVLVTIHLIGSLGWPAYVRFGVWMVLGMLIYCFYGIHAAEMAEVKERSRHASENEMQDGDQGAASIELPRLSTLEYDRPLQHSWDSPLGSPWQQDQGALSNGSEHSRLLTKQPTSDAG